MIAKILYATFASAVGLLILAGAGVAVLAVFLRQARHSFDRHDTHMDN